MPRKRKGDDKEASPEPAPEEDHGVVEEEASSELAPEEDDGVVEEEASPELASEGDNGAGKLTDVPPELRRVGAGVAGLVLQGAEGERPQATLR